MYLIILYNQPDGNIHCFIYWIMKKGYTKKLVNNIPKSEIIHHVLS